MDSIHIKHARFGMLIPSIIHNIETLLIAKDLSETLLQPLGISDLTLLLEAISSPSAAAWAHTPGENNAPPATHQLLC